MKKTLIPLIALLSACSPPADTHMGKFIPTVNSRVSVTRVAIFEDDIAYNGLRGAYLIKDLVTGKEFIGISGVGISEIGSHSTGKTIISDER
jgi:hypothetical protein